MVLFPAVIRTIFLLALLPVLLFGADRLAVESIHNFDQFFSGDYAKQSQAIISQISKESGVSVWVDVYPNEKTPGQRDVRRLRDWLLIRFYKESQLFVLSFDPSLEDRKLLFHWDANYLKNVVATFFSQSQRDYGLYRVLLALQQSLKCNRVLTQGGVCEVVPDQQLEFPAKRKPVIANVVLNPVGIVSAATFLLALISVSFLWRFKFQRVAHAE